MIKQLMASPQHNFFLLAGPCVIEGEEMALDIAEKAMKITQTLGIPYVFKGSDRKANRSRMDSFTGIGDEKALRILRKVGETFKIPVVTDIHEPVEADIAAEYVDVLQIPAFLCRQTDLLQAAASTGRIVNVKKGQFMAPWDLGGAISKIEHVAPNAAKNGQVWLTERGTTFGYGRLIVDMTSLVEMRRFGCPVIFDATHSVQQPSSQTGITGGNRTMVPYLMRAAVAVGVDGLFIETHPDPDKAISDAANQVKLSEMKALLEQAMEINSLIANR